MGNLDYYFYKKKELSGNDKLIEEKSLSSSKETRKDQKRIEAEVRKKRYDATKILKKKVDLIEEEIANLEELISTTEKELLNPEIFGNPSLAKEKSKLYESSKTLLQEKMNIWEELTSQLITIEESFNKLL
jgi:ATP-binding cassette subfamily F protein 3